MARARARRVPLTAAKKTATAKKKTSSAQKAPRKAPQNAQAGKGVGANSKGGAFTGQIKKRRRWKPGSKSFY